MTTSTTKLADRIFSKYHLRDNNKFLYLVVNAFAILSIANYFYNGTYNNSLLVLSIFIIVLELLESDYKKRHKPKIVTTAEGQATTIEVK